MQPEAQPPRRRPWRAVLVALAALVGVVVLGAVALVALVDTDAVIGRVKERVLPQLSERIGREIRVEEVGVGLLPTPTVRLGEVSVEGVGERPLLAAESAHARIDVWALLRSLGDEIRLESVELRGVEANILRLPDGRWSYEEILERLEETRPPDAAERAVAIDRVRIEDGTVRLVDLGAPGGAAIATWSGVEATARHIEPGERLTLELAAALQSDRRNLEATLQIDPLPADFDALEQGDWPEVTGSLRVRDAPLGALRNLLPAGLSEVATGGHLRATGSLETVDRRYVLSGNGGVSELALRGEPARAAFAFEGSFDPATKATVVAVRDIEVDGPGIELGGSAQVHAAPLRFEFALAGPLLDLDTLLGVLPEEEEEAPDEPLLPADMRRSIRQANGSGTIEVEKLVSGTLTATDVQMRARLQGGVLTLEDATADFYGGKVQAAGTTVHLTEEVPSWRLDASMEGVDLGEAMESIAGAAPLGGELASDVELEGAGVEWQALRQALSGLAQIEMAEGQLGTLDLDGAIADALANGLRALGQRASAERIEGGAATPLRDLRTQVRVDDGWMVLQRPITVRSSLGEVELGGRIGLDWALDLQGQAHLSPDFVARLTGGALRPAKAVAVPIQLGGTLREPAVRPIDREALARALLPVGRVERRVGEELEKAEDRARREARRRAGEVLRDVF